MPKDTFLSNHLEGGNSRLIISNHVSRMRTRSRTQLLLTIIIAALFHLFGMYVFISLLLPSLIWDKYCTYELLGYPIVTRYILHYSKVSKWTYSLTDVDPLQYLECWLREGMCSSFCFVLFFLCFIVSLNAV